MNPITSTLLSLGLTRDSKLWVWGRVVSGATLLISLLPAGMLDDYLSPSWKKWVTAVAVLVLWLSGKYDTSPLPGDNKK